MFMAQLNGEWVANKLPERPKDANKGTFGKVLVIAGSENYPGAAYLACAAAYRVGAGLVTLATIPSVKTIVSRKLPEITFLPLEDVNKKLSIYDVLLLGPGLGQEEQTTKFVKQLLKEKVPNTVIDGDGLNILSKMGKWWEKVRGELVLTPHPGEMARLTGASIAEIQSSREDTAKKFAKKWNQVVALKGAHSVIASPAGKVMISPFANPALATAGTGDILTGVIAGFLAQGLPSFNAACVGVSVHGLAAELIKEKLGDTGLVASDILLSLPPAIRKLKQNVKFF